mgnify:CR=1 FL=1
MGAWGKVLSVSGNAALVNVNPFRYRGYYYDIETQLYYLQTRYYDPEIGRFINADDVEILLAKESDNNNLFNYCQGDPINRLDREGKFFFTLTLSTVLWGIAAIVAGGVAAWSITKLLEQLVRDLKRIIDDVKAKARQKGKRKNKKVKHHIIAKAAPRAKIARDIFLSYCKNINDIRNLAYIWDCYHIFLHTYSYYDKVNEVISDADQNGKNERQKKDYVFQVLAKLKRELELQFG